MIIKTPEKSTIFACIISEVHAANSNYFSIIFREKHGFKLQLKESLRLCNEPILKKKIRLLVSLGNHCAHKMKFSIKNFFSTCYQIRGCLRIWSHLLKKFLMENFIFCAVAFSIGICITMMFRINVFGVTILLHCVKSVLIRSFFWSVFSCIRTSKNSEFGHFSHSVIYVITYSPITHFNLSVLQYNSF